MSDYPTEPRYAPAPVPGETFPLLRGMLRTAFEQQYGELYAEHVLPEEEFLFPPEAPALEALAASLPSGGVLSRADYPPDVPARRIGQGQGAENRPCPQRALQGP
jgi:hypothetical protein